MNQNNYMELIIDGKIYKMGGAEDEMYLQRIANYINEKISRLKRQECFTRLSSDYQFVMEALNLADDYFKEQDRANLLAEQKAAMEKEAYTLKHDLVKAQLDLEKLQRELDAEKLKEREQAGLAAKEKASAEREAYTLRHDLEKAQKELENLRKELEDEKQKSEELKAETGSLKSRLDQQNAMKAAAAAAAAVNQRTQNIR